MFVDLLRNWRIKFNTASPVSLATIIIFEACIKPGDRRSRWGKVRLLLKPLPKLGASLQMTSHQFDTEKPILRLTQEQVMKEVSLQPIIGGVKNSIPPRRHDSLTKAHKELTLFQKQRGNPLLLADPARIFIRQAVEAQHFIRIGEDLPLPSRVKSFLSGNFTTQLTTTVFEFNFPTAIMIKFHIAFK